MINVAGINKVLLVVALAPSLAFSQNYDVKKGKISLDKTLIAIYDGKGSIFRLFAGIYINIIALLILI